MASRWRISVIAAVKTATAALEKENRCEDRACRRHRRRRSGQPHRMSGPRAAWPRNAALPPSSITLPATPQFNPASEICRPYRRDGRWSVDLKRKRRMQRGRIGTFRLDDERLIGCDVDVKNRQATEPLGKNCLPRKPTILANAGYARADAERQFRADLAFPAETGTVIVFPFASATDTPSGLVFSTVAGRKFIFGEPRKPATKIFAGRL